MDNRCNCEDNGCHPNGDCKGEPHVKIVYFGLQETLCKVCFAHATVYARSGITILETK